MIGQWKHSGHHGELSYKLKRINNWMSWHRGVRTRMQLCRLMGHPLK